MHDHDEPGRPTAAANDAGDPAAIAALLGLERHPEGGHYRETWRHTANGRSAGTAIYFLLAGDEVSHWHRVDSAEIWHHYAGAAIDLCTWAPDAAAIESRVLGADLTSGERPQLIVEPGVWQTARSHGRWTLVGCTVSPGFEFDRFELAPPGWVPPVTSAP